jgi:hypothetical protein
MRRIVLMSLLLAGCSKEPARFTLVATSQTNLVYRLDTNTGEVIGLTWGKAFPIRNPVWDKKSGTYRLDDASAPPPPLPRPQGSSMADPFADWPDSFLSVTPLNLIVTRREAVR